MILRKVLALAVLLTASCMAFGQGCSLCRDATAGSAPQFRRSLRIAIPILAVPAIGMFSGILYAAMSRRTRHQDPDECRCRETQLP